jgi:hypothetical protein
LLRRSLCTPLAERTAAPARCGQVEREVQPLRFFDGGIIAHSSVGLATFARKKKSRTLTPPSPASLTSPPTGGAVCRLGVTHVFAHLSTKSPAQTSVAGEAQTSVAGEAQTAAGEGTERHFSRVFRQPPKERARGSRITLTKDWQCEIVIPLRTSLHTQVVDSFVGAPRGLAG